MRQTGDVLLGSAPGAGSLLLNTKASQEAACSRAPAAIVPGQEPELHDAGVSRSGGNGSHLAATDAAEGHAGHADGPGSSGNAGNGSHLAATGAAEGHAGHADGPGSSRNAENGSHLAATGFSDGLQQWARGGPVTAGPIAPYRIRPSVVRDGLAGPCGAENGPVVYARLVLASGAARGGGSKSRCGGKSGTRAVADNTLIIKQKSILPVGKTRQDKSLFRSLSDAYLPPLRCVVLKKVYQKK